ncbi:MAG: EamA family transporter RarD [Planctomycetota bacterium]
MQSTADRTRHIEGVLYAVGAYSIWGFLFPVWLVWGNRMVGPASSTPGWSLELLAQRVVWAVVVCLMLVACRRQFRDLAGLLRRPKLVATLVLTTALVTVNWVAFIYGTATGRLSHASLGYYLNPLLSVALGVAFLGERIRPVQIAAILVAALGVLYQVFALGVVPWIALVVAITFGLYGLIRKRIGVGPVVGLTVETALVTPIALAYTIWAAIAQPEIAGGPARFASGAGVTTILVGAGVLTALPLLWFAAAASRLRLTTVGLMQYIAPTGQLFVALLLNGEPLTPDHAVVFGLIWAGVALFAWDSLRAAKHARPAQATDTAETCTSIPQKPERKAEPT